MATTIPHILEKYRQGKKLVVLTAYDATTARIVDETGVDMILVGDSLGMVMLGHANTLQVTMQEMLHHTHAVSKGVTNALLVADMPYLSFHLTPEETVRNAGRFLKEAGAHAVKIEGGRKRLEMLAALRRAEIPVMGHIGLTPQSIHEFGGYRVQGKTREHALALIDDVRALEEAGVFSIVFEGIPKELSRLLTKAASVPTIGIGAGPDCDGQVLVLQDMLGFYGDAVPKFVRRYANLREVISSAINEFQVDVQEGTFPSDDESYSMTQETLSSLLQELGQTDADREAD